jgi:hypothetical protein
LRASPQKESNVVEIIQKDGTNVDFVILFSGRSISESGIAFFGDRKRE